VSGLFGKYPAVVVSYDGAKRSCRVNIPGITDADVFPEAVFCNPLGDDAATTEIRIVPNAPIWVEFEAGDPRFPIIVGYRTPRAGNPTGWRRWQHQNIQLIAENTYLITVGGTSITVTDGLMKVEGADLEVSGNITSGKSITAALNVSDQGGAKSMAGMRATFGLHTHTETNTTTSTPNQSM
jgi:hypothetical protein